MNQKKEHRLIKWDYAWSGTYFITLNSRFQIHHFSQIQNSKIHLTEIGRIADKEWLRTPFLREDMHIKLGTYCIMPNHIHLLITIGWNSYNSKHEENRAKVSSPIDSQYIIPRKNVLSLIRGYKGAVTRQARKINYRFAWQPDFYDIILHDQQAIDNVERYIRNNPIKWNK